MPIQQFNDLASPNGPVATGGTRGGVTPSASNPAATGYPSGLIQGDGTNSPRADLQTFRSAGNTTPNSTKNRCPAQSFNPGSV